MSSAPGMREISITNRHPRLRLDRRALVRAIHHLDAHFRFTPTDLPTLNLAGRRRAKSQIANPKSQICSAPPGELSVSFLTDPALAKLHADYLDDPTTTDVITFEGDETMDHAGDICVSADTALAYSTRHDKPFAEELLRYVIHGWLHLAGYDDLEPRKKRRMRAAEDRALKLLRAAHLLPDFTLKSA
ncbi:MAG: rRNA maturation RNase YbeY [Burkholderiales bacterium]|nr:rRNA maturation RNase YbeY [Opitutaceae bacterium]